MTDAYRAAHSGAKKPAAAKKAAPARATPSKASKPAPVAKASAPAASAKVGKAAAPAVVAAPPAKAEAPADTSTPQPKPSVVTDDRRLVALGEEIKALTLRVEALEKASGGKSSTGKSNPFRRRS